MNIRQLLGNRVLVEKQNIENFIKDNNSYGLLVPSQSFHKVSIGKIIKLPETIHLFNGHNLSEGEYVLFSNAFFVTIELNKPDIGIISISNIMAKIEPEKSS